MADSRCKYDGKCRDDSMKKYIRNLFVSMALGLLLTACSTVPYSGRSQMLLTSIAEEKLMGEQAWAEISSKEKVTRNRKYSSAVIRVGRYISAVADQPEFQWEFKTFESEQPNAFCLPGGKVAVYTGLFQYTANDAELAAVVGHEIGHAIARHGGERVSQGILVDIGSELLSASVDPSMQQEWQLAYGLVANVGAILPYSRIHEYEADYIGLILMSKAGYDPRACISFWGKFGKLGSTSELGEFLSTHPIGEKRLEKMKEKLPEAFQYYNKAKTKHGLGVKY